MLRLMVVLARIALCAPLLLLPACKGSDDAVYPPEPATARQLPPVVAAPGHVLPSPRASAGCVTTGVVRADMNPLRLCLRIGKSATVVLPRAFADWWPAESDNHAVARVRGQHKTDDGGARFDVLATGLGAATITVNNPGTGEAPGRVAKVSVTVSG